MREPGKEKSTAAPRQLRGDGKGLACPVLQMKLLAESYRRNLDARYQKGSLPEDKAVQMQVVLDTLPPQAHTLEETKAEWRHCGAKTRLAVVQIYRANCGVLPRGHCSGAQTTPFFLLVFLPSWKRVRAKSNK